VVVPAGAGPIRGRQVGGVQRVVLMRHRWSVSQVARERGPENAGTAGALPLHR
jgi:hypothetical protein